MLCSLLGGRVSISLLGDRMSISLLGDRMLSCVVGAIYTRQAVEARRETLVTLSLLSNVSCNANGAVTNARLPRRCVKF